MTTGETGAGCLPGSEDLVERYDTRFTRENRPKFMFEDGTDEDTEDENLGIQPVRRAKSKNPNVIKTTPKESPQDLPPTVAESPQDLPPIVAKTPQDLPPTVAETPQDLPPTVAETPQDLPPTVAETPQDLPPTVAESPQDLVQENNEPMSQESPENNQDTNSGDFAGNESSESDQPPTPVEPRRSLRTLHRESAICDEIDEVGIGSFIYPSSRISVRLVKAHPSNSQHYLGLQLSMPRSEDVGSGTWYAGNHPDSLATSNKFTLLSRYPPGTAVMVYRTHDKDFEKMKGLVSHHNGKNDFAFIAICLPENEYPTIEGVGPFIPQHAEHGRYLDHDDLVEGKERLSRILFRRELILVTRVKHMKELLPFLTLDNFNSTPFDYGYGVREHRWDDKVYKKVIEANYGKPFPTITRYDNSELLDTALEMMHVQDVFEHRRDLGALCEDRHPYWFNTNADTLARSIKKPGSRYRVHLYCPGFDNTSWGSEEEIPISSMENPTPAEQFNQDCNADNENVEQGDSKSSLDSQHSVWDAITLPSTSSYLEAVDQSGAIPVSLKRKNEKDGGYKPEFADSYADAMKLPLSKIGTAAFFCHSGVRSESQRVSAVHRLRREAQTWPLTGDATTRQKIRQFFTGKGLDVPLPTTLDLESDEAIPMPTVPTFNLLGVDIDPAVLRQCLDLLDPDDKDRFQQYFSKMFFSMAVISAPAGSGKSHITAVIASILGLSESHSQCIVSAPSNIACDNIEERISGMAQGLVEKLSQGDPQLRIPMSVRGFAIHKEAGKLMSLLRGHAIKEDNELDPSPWKFRHSLCWWTARALGIELEGVEQLDVDRENENLVKLYTELQSLADTGPSCPPDEVGEGSEDDEDDEDIPDPEVEITTKKTFEDFTALVQIARKTMTFTEYEESQKAQAKKVALRNDIGRLMREVVRCANFVTVTPAMAGTQPYKSFNASHAQAALFDEAAAMHRTDGLMVYGNSMRPIFAVGDEKQLPPTLLTMGEMYPDGTAVNRFGQDAKLSWLSWLLHLKIPAFHLYKQHRMAQGMFDLSLRLTYSHLETRFSYGASAALENYPFASAIREFLVDHDGLELPPDTMSPVFVNCKECPCRIDGITKSKHNPRAIACMMEWLEDFVKAVQFPADRIVAITPYRSNLWHIRAELASSTLLKDVQAATIDSYQGRENDMVVLCLAVDKSTGPCFTAQPQRLNVATSRHKLFLVIFGDIETSQAADTTQVPSTSQSIQATAEGGAKTHIRSDMFNSLINWFKEKSRVVHVQGDPSIDPDEEFHGEGDAFMAVPATQEGTDEWGNPRLENLTHGWNVPDPSGASGGSGEPDPSGAGSGPEEPDQAVLAADLESPRQMVLAANGQGLTHWLEAGNSFPNVYEWYVPQPGT
ncbi:uncharacterized protein FFUJ_05251 [Fusarium fujikuroi IMI 58289]|uniref:DNA2/NAM7 helicase-like C-terminal domain-containing protein n=1 Tax=Gibberella fujikuroi (strain CBS 195.34 / IMI 58289 / NRRL A-6831) TaxID=1279085 RepID=S0DRJ7_GIBF5|nr:uncharacterized protein FFUJ_05251 [Fusarium fujikuroi IMI 58289]CCT65055.1 uncharacterized protein FFUJ_05251 [Fusarium fujikuroi IMI 58289]